MPSPVVSRVGFAMMSVLGLAGCPRPGAEGRKPGAAELLPVGAPAPDFETTAHDGARVKLSALRGRDVVLYFYPMDDTSGCTKEACDFRDAWAQLQEAGVAVFGISTQGNATHVRFAQKYHLPFPLLPDDKGELAGKYHVPLTFGLAHRVTYLIGKDGHIKRVWEKVTPAGHAAEILAAVRG
jgi:thioredoxin-dependent peroxiredoxin